MKKKIISSLLALTLVVSASAVAVAGYVDIAPNHTDQVCDGGGGGGRPGGGGGGGGSDHLAGQD